MTQPSPPNRPPDPRQLARDVARQLDHRRMRRRLTLWAVLLALVAAAALYLRCGGGFGLLGIGGAGEGDGNDAPRPVIAPVRCAIRVSAGGISLGGHPMSRDEAVAACKGTPGAEVIVTGDARHGDREELLTALRAAGIEIVVHDLVRPPAVPGAPPRK